MKRVGLALLALFLIIPLLATAVILTLGSQAADPCAGGGTGGSTATGAGLAASLEGGAASSLSASQRAVVARVIAEGRRRQVPARGIVVALAVAGAESRYLVYANDGRGGDLRADQQGVDRSLRLPHDAVGSDHGSVGVFQQQWPWWGSMRELMDPGASAAKFYAALVRVPRWESLPVAVVAQRVQRSAVPSAYTRWESLASSLVAQAGPATATPVGTTATAASGSAEMVGLGPGARRAAAWVRSRFGFTGTIGGYADRNIAGTNTKSKHASGLAIDVMIPLGADADAITDYFAGPGYGAFGVDNVIHNRRIYNKARGWHPYTGVSPHTDHVHIDFLGRGAAVAGTGAGTGQAADGLGAISPVGSAGAPAKCVLAGDAVLAAGSVVYPVEKSTDRGNYGGSGPRWARGHTGTDFSIACGTPVRAATGGTVEIDTNQGWAGRWLVKVVTGSTSVATWYAHMRQVTVRAGEVVTAGQQVGEVGDLGNATGCHLHFEVHPRNGGIYEDGVDPSVWLRQHVGTGIVAVSAATGVVGATGGGTVPLAALGPPTGSSYQLATFNILGANHHRGAPWGTRLTATVRLFANYSVDVAALQEVHPPQSTALPGRLGGTYTRYFDPQQPDNQLMWRRDMFTIDQSRSRMLLVPYFGGHPKPMPMVRLVHKTTGRGAYFIGVHNPADVRGPAAAYRAKAVRMELQAAAAAQAATGEPVYLLGDMNARGSFAAQIRGRLRSAMPRGYGGIDWITQTSNGTAGGRSWTTRRWSTWPPTTRSWWLGWVAARLRLAGSSLRRPARYIHRVNQPGKEEDERKAREVFVAARKAEGSSEPRKHHFVPASYLRRWQQHGQIRVTELGVKSYVTAPARAARKTDFYRVEHPSIDKDEVPPLLFETMLGKLECSAKASIDVLLQGQPADLDDTAVGEFAWYLAMQITRGRSFREENRHHLSSAYRLQYANVSDDYIRKRLREKQLPVTPEAVRESREFLDRLKAGDVDYGPSDIALVGQAGRVAKELIGCFLARSWYVFKTPPTLLTCDEPVVMLGGPGSLRDERGGVGTSGVILHPLSPSRLLVMFHPALQPQGPLVLDTAETLDINREILAATYRLAFDQPHRKLAERLPVPPPLARPLLPEGPLRWDSPERGDLFMIRHRNRWASVDSPPPWPVGRWWYRAPGVGPEGSPLPAVGNAADWAGEGD